MIELKQFRLGVVASQFHTFDFERASVALLARHKSPRAIAVCVTASDELHDLGSLRGNAVAQQGAHHHG